MARVKGM